MSREQILDLTQSGTRERSTRGIPAVPRRECRLFLTSRQSGHNCERLLPFHHTLNIFRLCDRYAKNVGSGTTDQWEIIVQHSRRNQPGTRRLTLCAFGRDHKATLHFVPSHFLLYPCVYHQHTKGEQQDCSSSGASGTSCHDSS